MKKKILFLHPNFPAQFKNVVNHFARNHEIIFICQTNYCRPDKSIKVLVLTGKLGEEKLNSLKLDTIQRAFKLADQYRNSFNELIRRNWIPDIIISHSGWGCGAYAKECWPESNMISYLEWWFDPNSTTYTYNPNNSDLGLTKETGTRHWLRNAILSLEITAADTIISPTKWQKNQLPASVKSKCQVIYDGIDQKIYNNIETGSDYEQNNHQILTYGTRGMEPMRCFPEFITCLPRIIEKNPKVLVQIAGTDEINYGGVRPASGSWKKWALEYLNKHECQDNIVWLGRLDEKKYVSWLKQSSCHVYLTHPFVTSWSLIEAIHCCKKIVASDVEAVREFYTRDRMKLVDHRNHDLLVKTIISQLKNNTNSGHEQLNPGMDRLGIATCMREWEEACGLQVNIEGEVN